MGALFTAFNTTDPAAAEYRLAVESEVQQFVVTALGDAPEIDAVGVARVVGHVWFSATSRRVGGLAPAGGVERELGHAVRMMTADGALA